MSSPMQSEENFTMRDTQKDSTRRKIPAYLQKMNSSDKAANDKVIQSMQKKINYLKNPRFRISRPPVSFQQDATTFANDPKDPFRVTPEVITFTDYNVNCIYEIPLTLTNASSVLKRVKHMPPATPEFSVPKVKYPSETGIIAPGMSAVFYVNFLASSLSDFNDELLIVTEESSFKVKLQARREHPVLTLPEVLDCQGCWVGDRVDMAFPFTNKAGEASYKFFCENEEDDKYQTGDILKLENFTVYPSEFSISKGQKIELFVCFTPKREGLIEEKVILACDNNTSKVYTLKAVANMAEFRVTKINGNVFENSEGFKNFYMTQAQPKFPKSSVLTIKNDTYVKVDYHWTIQDEKDADQVDGAQQHAKYKIEPEKGVFEPNSEKDFKITFESDISRPFYKNISLVIDDVPIEAIRNPPEIIKKQTLEHQATNGDAGKVRPSLTYFEFAIVSETIFNKVEISPPAYFFPTPISINRDYTQKFRLKNLSKGPVGYKVRGNGKTADFVSCRVINNQGEIPGKGEIDLETVIYCDRPAVNQKCVFIVEIENCDPIAFQITASFVGPKIKIKQAAVSYGLVRTHSKSSFELEIENISDIQAEVLLRRQGEEVTFADYKDEEPFYQWWDNLVYFEPQYLTLSPKETRKIKVILNSRSSETIKDIVEILTLNGQTEYLLLTAEVQGVYVSLNRFSLSFPELFTSKFYEIGGDHEQSIVLSNYGNIEAKFEWPDVRETDFEASFEPKSGIIPPKSDIPITLKMVPYIGKTIHKIIECQVSGLDGPMGFELIAKVVGLNVSYELHEEESAPVSGRPKKKGGLVESLSSLQGKGEPRSLAHTTLSAITKQHVEAMKIRQNLEKIELMDLLITEPRTVKFVLRNISGLNTHFKLYSENFDPKAHKIDSLAEFRHHETHQTFGSSSTEQRKKLAALSPGKLGSSKKKALGSTFNKTHYPLLSSAIEKIDNFTSEGGKALNHARRLEKDQKFYLGNNKGIAVVCEPHEGELKAYQEIVVTVTIYNDTCGRFEDFLCSEITGLQTVKFPIDMKISGSPLVVTPNQVGVDYKAEYPTMNLEPRMHSLGVYKRQLKLTNTSPTEMNLSWKVYNLSGHVPNTNDYFGIKFGEPSIGSKDFIRVEWSPIPPPEATEGPFKISPQTARLKPRCTETFTITFSSNQIAKYDAVALCESELIREVDELQQGSTKPNSLPVYLKATTITPFLTLDKMKRMDGTHVIKLEKWALVQAKKQRRNVILRNHTPAHLDFTVQIDGPFRILDIKTSSLEKHEILPQVKDLTTKSEARVPLRSEAFVELLIEFEGYNEKDHDKWPLCPIMRVPGLIHITYANGDYQSFELEGSLLRPVLEINTAGFEGKAVEEVLDFGVSHIHNSVQKTIYLANASKVPAKWRLNYIKYPTKKILGLATVTKIDLEDSKKTDDPEVFEFSISEGLIGGKTIPVNKMPEGRAFEGYMTRQFNGVPPPSFYGTGSAAGGFMSSSMLKHSEAPMKVMVNFKPKMNILYKSKYRITIEEGPSIDVILRGMGTYEEKFEK